MFPFNGRWHSCSVEGIAWSSYAVAAPFEQGEIGPDLFRAACGMGLEGMVSKRADRPYRAGRSKDWVKVKNRKHPAMDRVLEAKAPQVVRTAR